MTAPAAPTTSPKVVVRCDSLVHVFRTPGQEVAALRGVDLEVREGETVALLGPSGAGKTTLLWHLAGLMRPTAGTVEVAGHRLADLSAGELARMRADEIGVVLQNPSSNLLPYATALSNIAFAMRRRTRSLESRAEVGSGKGRWRALELLHSVGLFESANKAAGSFSGGEQQRLAVAVALANSPKILLADEPTSQLDAASADSVLDVIARANRELGTTIVAVTHDEAVAATLGRTATIRDGRVGLEGRSGEDFVVVGKDGTLTLPPEALHHLPPGSLARATPHEHGVDLRRVDAPNSEPNSPVE